jgi:hypothetical protein
LHLIRRVVEGDDVSIAVVADVFGVVTDGVVDVGGSVAGGIVGVGVIVSVM